MASLLFCLNSKPRCNEIKNGQTVLKFAKKKQQQQKPDLFMSAVILVNREFSLLNVFFQSDYKEMSSSAGIVDMSL